MSKIKLYNKFFLLFSISESKEKLFLIIHSHNTFLLVELYPLYLQLNSHKDKYLLLNSFFLLNKVLLFIKSDIFQ